MGAVAWIAEEEVVRDAAVGRDLGAMNAVDWERDARMVRVEARRTIVTSVSSVVVLSQV